MTFLRRIGQQVTKRTTQQTRAQNRIVVTGCQVVAAGHDDRVQDDDLTKKDDFLFGKRATEELPLIAVSVREIFVTTVDTSVVSSVIIGMKRRQTRDYSFYRTRAVASIQLLNFEGYPYHFTKASVRLPESEG